MAKTIDLGRVRGGAELDEIVNMVYPVGSIYMSVNDVNPQTLFGGEWEQLKDRFLLGAGDTYANETTGGEATHTLVESELPRINGVIWASAGGVAVFSNGTGAFSTYGSQLSAPSWSGGSAKKYDAISLNIGGGKDHNNMPPYLAVYMWKRTA